MLSWLIMVILFDVITLLFGLCLLLGSFLLLLEALLSIWIHVELDGELAIVVDFDSDHAIEVELKPLERHYHEARKLLHASSLEGIDLLVAGSAVVGVVTLEHIALDECLKTLLERLLVFDCHANREERLRSIEPVGASFGDHFTGEGSSEVGLNGFFLGSSFDGRLQSVEEHL